MAKKLYVGNLPYTLKDADLNQLFTQAGTVESAVVINDKATGRSKGFGFVEMSTDEEATKAIEMFDGQELEGRKLTVNEARPMQPREDRGGFRGGNRF
ncbi:MAG: RNA recognition motif-containing protein [Candidatus Moranbacteria bacterium GW2011_GWE1_35_17]|nr:MAG: RNA recognition motif-containing protein [Candidatus Moranbacteria bacterium GW2011_GWE1_35_17]KKP71571.1 MAG: RNA recognition motif-containing protein [Candidatus Moranbacteria bacterium GW2011_GWE2_35_164]KKP84980.1 MAG: RNA recognition motif-containing protein [Candidatus Moranbacteria bacterium GW2011_GWF2_35_54]